MGLFDMFGKSFDDQVNNAMSDIGATTPGVSDLQAEVRGKVVTIKGKAENRAAANLVMERLDQAVKADNIVNAIEVAEKPVPQPEPEPAPEPVSAERFYEVVAGDTLGAISQMYYGKASQYMKIFEANRNILDNPDLIKVGQKLKIPE